MVWLRRTYRPADYPGSPATVARAQMQGVILRESSWGIGDSVIALVGTWLLGLGVAIVVGVTQAVTGVPGGVPLVVASVVPWAAMAGWPAYITAKRGNGPIVDLGLLFRPVDILWGVAGGVVSLALGTAAAYVTELLIGGFDSAAAEAATEAASSGGRWQLLVFAVIVAVGAPFVEEFLFRGMLWAGLARAGLRPVLTLTVTTLLFAVFHFEVSRIAVLLAIGVVFGFLRLRTARLGAPMIAHGVNNLPGAVAIALS